MDAAYETFVAKLGELVDRFEKYKPIYRTDGYDETTLRLEYLNPLFKALGWDVDNEAGTPPHLRAVRVEYPTPDGRSNRRADYVFRINGFDRFVCEAKKFPENLDRWHYQAQNYAFNLRLWVAIITNFDELAVFVVGGKPDRQRPFSPTPGWRIYSHEYKSIAKKIWDLLSRGAVENGSIEHYIQDLPKVRPRAGKQLWLIKPDRNRTVDNEFLRYLETQRARLAKSLFNDNRSVDWTHGGLNEAVRQVAFSTRLRR